MIDMGNVHTIANSLAVKVRKESFYFNILEFCFYFFMVLRLRRYKSLSAGNVHALSVSPSPLFLLSDVALISSSPHTYLILHHPPSTILLYPLPLHTHYHPTPSNPSPPPTPPDHPYQAISNVALSSLPVSPFMCQGIDGTPVSVRTHLFSFIRSFFSIFLSIFLFLKYHTLWDRWKRGQVLVRAFSSSFFLFYSTPSVLFVSLVVLALFNWIPASIGNLPIIK